MSTQDYYDSFIQPYLIEQISYAEYCETFSTRYEHKIPSSIYLYGVSLPLNLGEASMVV